MTNQPVILFDGVCNLCNRAVQYIIKHDPAAIFLFASLQGNTGQQLVKQYRFAPDNLHSFVLIQNEKAYTKSTAALKVVKQLGSPAKLLYGFIIVPRFIRDAVYAFIAANRYKWFGKNATCMIPHPEWAGRFLN